MSMNNLAPKSPFLDATSFPVTESESLSDTNEVFSFLHSVSPFTSTYENQLGIPESPESEEFSVLLSELYNDQFDESVFQLIAEARELVESQISQSAFPDQQELILSEHFAPLSVELEGLLTDMEIKLSEYDLDSMTTREIDDFVDSFQMRQSYSPGFEGFWGSIKKALKKGARFVKNKAKKLASKAFGFVLKKVAKFVKPWINKIVKYAINKLPKKYRPLAKTLAQKMGLTKELEEHLAADDSIANVDQFQMEFNVLLANLVTSPPDAQQDLIIAEINVDSESSVDSEENYYLAREQFVEKILNDDEQVEPEKLVEEFIPAILPIVKTGMKLIGRKKIVNFIAKRMARLIAKFVGKKNAYPLSKAITNAGLRLINLEATDQDAIQLAGEAVASVVESAVRQIAVLPDYIIDNENLLEGYLVEAFESAAASNLPDILPEETYLQRPNLREAQSHGATWLLQPLHGRKFYKKYSRIYQKKLSPHRLRHVITYNGLNLSELLQEQYGLKPGENIDAKIHLYEMMPGSSLPQLSRLETATRGLGNWGNTAYSQLHPLTHEAAEYLLGEPGLGRSVEPRYLRDRHTTGIGQRFYYIELPANRIKRKTCSSDLGLTFDFPRKQFRASLFISELLAQNLALKLRQNQAIGLVVSELIALLEQRLAYLLSNFYSNRIRIIHGNIDIRNRQNANLLYLNQIQRRNFSATILENLGRGLHKYLIEQKNLFLENVADSADGVTFVMTVRNSPGLQQLENALLGIPSSTYMEEGIPDVNVTNIAGKASD